MYQGAQILGVQTSLTHLISTHFLGVHGPSHHFNPHSRRHLHREGHRNLGSVHRLIHGGSSEYCHQFPEVRNFPIFSITGPTRSSSSSAIFEAIAFNSSHLRRVWYCCECKEHSNYAVNQSITLTLSPRTCRTRSQVFRVRRQICPPMPQSR